MAAPTRVEAAGYAQNVTFGATLTAVTDLTLSVLLLCAAVAGGAGGNFNASGGPSKPIEVLIEVMGVDPGASGTIY